MRVNHSIAALILFGLVLPPSAHGDKVKGFYAGSTGGTNEYHRVVFIEFAADGSAIVQQTRDEKETHTWHARWMKSRNSITLITTPSRTLRLRPRSSFPSKAEL